MRWKSLRDMPCTGCETHPIRARLFYASTSQEISVSCMLDDSVTHVANLAASSMVPCQVTQLLSTAVFPDGKACSMQYPTSRPTVRPCRVGPSSQ